MDASINGTGEGYVVPDLFVDASLVCVSRNLGAHLITVNFLICKLEKIFRISRSNAEKRRQWRGTESNGSDFPLPARTFVPSPLRETSPGNT